MNTVVCSRIRLGNVISLIYPIIFALFPFFAGCNSGTEKSYFFLFDEHLIKESDNNRIRYSYAYSWENPEIGTMSVEYILIHNYKNDTTFKAPAEFLNHHEIFDGKWFSDIKRVSSFWNRHFDSDNDTLRIFMGELTPAGDSVVFYRVGRTWFPYM